MVDALAKHYLFQVRIWLAGLDCRIIAVHRAHRAIHPMACVCSIYSSQALQEQLGQFVEGLRPEGLSVSVLSGQVRLVDLKVRPEALDGLGLPVKVVSGSIGSIEINIDSYFNLASTPIRVAVKDIFILVKKAVLTPEELERRSKKSRIASIQQASILWKQERAREISKSSKADGKEDDQALLPGGMVGQILSNL